MLTRAGAVRLVAMLAAVVLGGCAPMAAAPGAGRAPELLDATMRQYTFRGEFEATQPLIRARDWRGLAALAGAHLAREPNRGEWWQIAGYAQLQAGDLAAARDSLARAVRLLPEEIGILNLHAAVLARLGEARLAALAIDRALQTDPVSTTAWVIAGDLHAAAGRLRDAVAAYDRALEIDRRDAFAWRAIGTLARRAGDRAQLERAIAALRTLYPPFADELARSP
ncbi:MAG: hypothetical protein JNM90_12175 [Burkholderiales bacterium]|nr:hypothetical protein [Burkholderiales bacterium]